jgi:hypothetical protein
VRGFVAVEREIQPIDADLGDFRENRRVGRHRLMRAVARLATKPATPGRRSSKSWTAWDDAMSSGPPTAKPTGTATLSMTAAACSRAAPGPTLEPDSTNTARTRESLPASASDVMPPHELLAATTRSRSKRPAYNPPARSFWSRAQSIALAWSAAVVRSEMSGSLPAGAVMATTTNPAAAQRSSKVRHVALWRTQPPLAQTTTGRRVPSARRSVGRYTL